MAEAIGARNRVHKKRYSKNKKCASRRVMGDSGFPFLDDERTIAHIRKSKVIFVMRGLPGSGKSTVVRQIKSEYRRAVVCSADDHFLKDGVYHFDHEQLSDAHAQCQGLAREACSNGRHVVVIDNTNVSLWEMKVYQQMAQQYDYLFIPVMPRTPWRFDPVKLATLNKHGVCKEVLQKKVHLFQKFNPYYWGWFVGEECSNKLIAEGLDYLRLCVKKVPEFAAIFNGRTGNDWVSWSGYYKRVTSTTPHLHCTAFYGGRGKEPGAAEYEKNPNVEEAFGQHNLLNVIGYYFTPRTAGVRIALDDDQLKVWGKNDKEGMPSARSTRDSLRSGTANPGDVDEAAGQLSLVDIGSGRKSKRLAAIGSRFRPTSGLGSRAHLTLATAESVEAVQTGLDLVEIIHLEASMLNALTVEMDGGAIRFYGEGRCVVYLDEPVRVSALFGAAY